MKLIILKSIQLSVITTSFLTSCFVLPNAHARDVLLQRNPIDIVRSSDAGGRIYLQETYGSIAYPSESKIINGESFTYTMIHGNLDQPKWGSFIVTRVTKNDQEEDVIFNSKEEASQFCIDLNNAANGTNGGQQGSIFAVDAPYHRVIEVPYKIAYDHDSQEADDGTSTPARKYVMCPNYDKPYTWILDPTRTDENEAAGILSSKMIDGHYQVTCMPAAHKPVATFWFSGASITNGVDVYRVNLGNLTNLHQYNKLVGAQYCPQRYGDIPSLALETQ